jgi:hypothetical protein
MEEGHKSAAVGLLGIGLGLLILAQLFNFIDAKPVLDALWPIILVVTGLVLVGSNQMVGSSLIGIGFLSLLFRWGILGTGGNYLIVLLLVALGVAALVRGLRPKPLN